MNPFERWFKCSICGELIKEDWSQGVLNSSTSTYSRLMHMIKHNFSEVDSNERTER